MSPVGPGRAVARRISGRGIAPRGDRFRDQNEACARPSGRRRRRVLVSAALGAGLALAACSDKAGANATTIVATDSACTVAKTTLAAGANTFEVTNGGSRVTEVYVYGNGDRVVAERENIGPGTKATFSADIAAGTYEVACKPGQTGTGIRQAITVTGTGPAAGPAAAGRTVALGAEDYRYTGLDGVTVAKGETIEFTMTNNGSVEHELEVLHPDGKTLGEIGPTAAGKAGKVTLTFADAGTYRFRCGIADHAQRGMQGTLTVT